MELQYNFLNLISEVGQNSTTKATYTWSADGTKLGVREPEVNGGGFEYLGSLIYKYVNGELQLESTSFSNGRIIASHGSSSTYTPNYFITDHLGSTRVAWDGSNTERSDYYPFGGRWTSAGTQATTNRFQYNGKELQTTGGVNYLDYGARMYDSRIGRWHSVDRFSEEYYPYSPYNYAIGNPLLFIDVNGDYISFYELAQYQNNLPNYSYSVNATDIDAGGWSISRYYNDDGDIVGYGAWRDGQFYVMDEEGDLDIFLNKLSTFSNAADLFYMNGSPSEGMLAMLSGDYFKGLGLLWLDAISDPGYYFYLANAIGGAAIGLPSARQTMNPNAYHVTRNGVTLPKGNVIPANLVQNRYLPASYGVEVNGRFVEAIRIDAATPPGYKGPNASHYHLNGSKTHQTTNWPYKK